MGFHRKGPKPVELAPECIVHQVAHVGRGALPLRPVPRRRGRGGAQGAALRHGFEERRTEWGLLT